MEREDHRPASLLSLVPCSCVLGISTSICPEVGRERNMYVEIHSRVSWGWRARVDWDWCWDDRGCVYSNGYQILQLNSDVWLSSLDGYRKNVLIHVSYEHYVGLSVESMLSLSRQLLRGIAHAFRSVSRNFSFRSPRYPRSILPIINWGKFTQD
jgi:hypothetical protein